MDEAGIHQRWRRSPLRRISGLGVGLVLGLSTVAPVGAFPAPGVVARAASPATPNHFNPTSRVASTKAAPVRTSGPAPASRRAPPPRPRPPATTGMQPGTIALTPSQPARFTSSDSTLELDVPAGAVSAADVTAAGGKLGLVVRQVAPASGGSAGGSGVFTFGTYLVQVVDAKGQLAKQGLRQPLGVTLHYASRAGAVDAGQAVAVVNGPLPRGVEPDPARALAKPAAGTAAAGPATRPLALGRMVRQRAAVDLAAHTLSVSAAATAASTTVSFATSAAVAAFGGPDATETDLGSGALVQRFPLDLPAGPGGLTPPLSLVYDSAAVSDQHDPAAAAPWVGEGWNLSLGQISWAERNTDLGCCASPQWDDAWQLVDGFGTDAELIPPTPTTSTYYEDFNGTAISPSPQSWHTTPETHARVISYVGPDALPGQAANPPCFRAFLPSGIMEEFGCTPDSLQFYPQSSGPDAGRDFIANWLLDLITDPSGNQIHVTYQPDLQNAGGIAYARDDVMATVEYDSPGCHSSQAMCTGAAWAPLMRVAFSISHAVTHVAGSSCPANGSVRCDDPVDLSASGGLPAPQVQSTFVLNDAFVEVRGGAAAGWNVLRDYQLAYDQSGPTTILDPFSGVNRSTVGRLDLTRLTEIGADGSTALPSRSFGYSRQVQLYEDAAWAPAPATNCGPSWNAGQTFGQGCNLWSQSYEGNSYYLASIANGQGLQQSFSWLLARDNVQGVPAGMNVLDPSVCDAAQSTSPCDVADDEAWSRVVLISQSATVLRSSQAGQGGAQTSTPVTGTTGYTYVLMPLDDYWGDWFDTDVVDFYNGRFMGFGIVTVTNPDGSKDSHQYPGSEGWGVYDPAQFSGSCTAANPCPKSPWWDPANALHGRELEVDRYNPDGSLVQVVKTQYQVLCPPAGAPADVAGNLISELDANGNPVAVCDIAPSQVDAYSVDGGSLSTAPHLTTTYAYDGLGRVTSETRTSNDGGGAGSPTTIVDRAWYTTIDTLTATATSATGLFDVDMPYARTVEDTAGNRYRCNYINYDALGRVTVDSLFTNCGTPANGYAVSGQVATYTTYDQFGNVRATDDPDAMSGNTAHQGCAAPGGTFSSCATYDGTFGALPKSTANALDQVSSTGYQAPGAWTVTDSSGGGTHGAVVGPVALGVPGPPVTDGVATAMGFFNQGYLSVPDSARWHQPVISVEAWVYKTVDVDWQRVAGIGSWPNSSLLISADNTGRLQLVVVASPTSIAAVVTPTAIPLNTWAHVVGTFDGATVSLYLNGVLVAQRGMAAAMETGSGGLGIAADPNGQNPWNGRLADVAVFDAALPAGEVQAHYDSPDRYGSRVMADAPAAFYRLADSPPESSGFGLRPTSTTDANGQTTSLAYDALGRPTATTLPGETPGLTTTGMAYTVWCSGASAQAPCVEVDRTQRLNASTTTTARTFYDGLGHQVETRTPAPGGQDVVRYLLYDQLGRLAFSSVPYFVAAYAGGPGAAAFSIPDSTQAGTTTTYDGLGRTTSVTDALSHRSTAAYSMACGTAGSGDSACYQEVLSVDGDGHQSGSLADALGRVTYEQRYSGTGASAAFTLYATTRNTYDFLGNLVQVLHPDGVTKTTTQYDSAGRETGMTDPDLGTQTYAYDANGNLVESADARGAAGTVFTLYDGLSRPLWHNTTNTPNGAFATYSYDSTAGGSAGVGRLTGETFTNGSLAGSYSYTYDGRGQEAAQMVTVGGSSYSTSTTYDDAGDALTQQYPDGEVVSDAYTAQGWLSAISAQQGASTTALFSGASYTGTGGALGMVTGASLGGGTYALSSSIDPMGRATDIRWTAGGATRFDQSRTFDGVGNVSTVSTTLPGGTDSQTFCYDEQNRLTWAGSTGTPPCTGSLIAAGTLGAGQYSQSFTYDTLGRLTSGPPGSYAYADPSHTHAVTAASGGYTAGYDAAGNMTCRATNGSTTCVGGSPTGAQLAYDSEGRLASWQAGGVTETFLYDCQGQRVAQQVTQSGATTTTVFVGDAESVATGATNATRTFYYAGGSRIATASGGTLTYLASDAQGSTTVALGTGGTASGSQLFAPYGSVRYASGGIPTAFGFIGQRSDGNSGLDYFDARYYDPLVGQFASADSVTPGGGYDPWGLSRYAYTSGNPTSRSDPGGHDGGDGFDFGFSFDPSTIDTSTTFDFSNFNFGVDTSSVGMLNTSGSGGFNVMPGTDTSTMGGVSLAGLNFDNGVSPMTSTGFDGMPMNMPGTAAFPTFDNVDFGGANLSQYGIASGAWPDGVSTMIGSLPYAGDPMGFVYDPEGALAFAAITNAQTTFVNPGFVSGPLNVAYGAFQLGIGIPATIGGGIAIATGLTVGAPVTATVLVAGGIVVGAAGLYNTVSGAASVSGGINQFAGAMNAPWVQMSAAGWFGTIGVNLTPFPFVASTYAWGRSWFQ